jgi:hypothetical protein
MDAQSPKMKVPGISHAVKIRLIAVFVALSLSVTYYYIIKPWAMGVPGNSTNFMVFSAMSNASYHLNSLEEVWRPRVGGMWLAGRLVDGIVKNGLINLQDYQNNNIVVLNVQNQEGQQVFGNYFYTEDYRSAFGLYHACWLFLFFVMIIFFVEDPVFVILACFAGLFYMLTPNSGYYSYPWDIPSMTFFTLNYLLWKRKLYAWMLPVFAVGHFFKETVAVTAVLYFFTDLHWRKRIAYFAIAFVLTLLVKMVITEMVEGRIIIITQVRGGETHGFFSYLKHNFFTYLDANLKFIFSLQWNHFVFVNAGTFVLALFLPMRTKIEMGAKAILLLFFGGQLLAGCLNEFRVMLEVLPVSILYLKQTLDGWKEKIPVAQEVQNKSSPPSLKKKPKN